MSTYYFEDFSVGQRFETEPHTTTEAEALAFAKRYDPQPHHTDPVAARDSLFGALVLSGWETASIIMGQKLRNTPLGQVATGLVGIGIDNLRWPKAVEPGDTLRATITIIAARPSNSRPDKGVVKYKIEAFNQRDELVMGMEVAVLMPRRSA
ncbi:MAG: MaoC family dehydratase [Alphaproteobacteria bacterium]|nr:MaoC family dehydratase [Alphaproteobacteria bacterium]